MQCRQKAGVNTEPQENLKNATTTAPGQKDKMVALYLFEPGVDIDNFFADCKIWGVNMVFSNSVYWDNKEFSEKAKHYGVGAGLLFPVFFNQDYLQTHPEDYCITSEGNKAIKSWLHFGCPSSEPFMRHQKAYFRKALASVNPEMVALDFIRFYVQWEKVSADASFPEIEDGCYCERCLNEFEKFSGVNVTNKTPQWIKLNMLRQWSDWKCHVIENTVTEYAAIARAYNAHVPVGIKTVPWAKEQHAGAIRSIAGQDLDLLKDHIDFVMPMTYSHLLGQSPGWINQMLAEVNSMTGKDVYATVQIEKVFPEQSDIQEDEFKNFLTEGFREPSKGIVLFHYRNFPGNRSKAELIKVIKSG